MAVGTSTAAANDLLDFLLTTAGPLWVKLYVGDPGAAGTANAATETTRLLLVPTAASGGAASNATDLLWALVGGSEDYSHFGLWTDETGGTFRLSGTLTTDPVTAGDTFVIPAGDLDITVTPLAA